MSRKHFEAIAEALRGIRKRVTGFEFATCVSAMADVCEGANPRFDRTRFERACNGTD